MNVLGPCSLLYKLFASGGEEERLCTVKRINYRNAQRLSILFYNVERFVIENLSQ